LHACTAAQSLALRKANTINCLDSFLPLDCPHLSFFLISELVSHKFGTEDFLLGKILTSLKRTTMSFFPLQNVHQEGMITSKVPLNCILRVPKYPWNFNAHGTNSISFFTGGFRQQRVNLQVNASGNCRWDAATAAERLLSAPEINYGTL
jgi:hypothetical protein